MLYPDKLVNVQDGLTLYVPDPELVKPVYEAMLAKEASTPFPFWARIWPSAIAMSTFLQTETDWIEGKRVLELGAGIGLPSFVMAAHAAEMIISDHAPDAVALIEKNIRYTGLQHVKARLLDWNDFPDDITAEVLLLSDINYADDQFEPLLILIRKFLEQGTTILLSTPHRINVNPFVSALQPFIKRSVLHSVAHLNQSVEIRILILSI